MSTSFSCKMLWFDPLYHKVPWVPLGAIHPSPKALQREYTQSTARYGPKQTKFSTQLYNIKMRNRQFKNGKLKILNSDIKCY